MSQICKTFCHVNQCQQSAVAVPQRTYLGFEDGAPSWEELQAMVDAKKKELGVQEPDLESGPFHPLALRRTFGKPGEPTVKLYRVSSK